MFNDTKLVHYAGKDLRPRDELEFEILRDAESYRRNEEKARELRRDNIREFIGLLVILGGLPLIFIILITIG